MCTVYQYAYSVYSVGKPLAFHTFVLESPHMASSVWRWNAFCRLPSHGQIAYKLLLWETIVCMTQQTNLVDLLLLIFLFRNTQTRWWQLKYFSFSPRKLGKMNRFWRAYVSKRLVQPPARKPLFLLHKAKVLPTSQAFLLIFLNLKGSQSCREGSWLNSSQRGFRFFFFFRRRKTAIIRFFFLGTIKWRFRPSREVWGCGVGGGNLYGWIRLAEL